MASSSPSHSDIEMAETLGSMPSASTDTKMAETETAVSSSSMPTSYTKMAATLHSTPSSSSSDTKMSETLDPAASFSMASSTPSAASDVKMAAETLEFKPSASSDVKMDAEAEREKAIADMEAQSLREHYKEKARKLWRVQSTLLVMLSDRGYRPEKEIEILKDPDDKAEEEEEEEEKKKRKKTDMEEEEEQKKKKKKTDMEAFVNKYGNKKFKRKVLNSIFVKENQPDCKICVFFYKGITAKKLKSCIKDSYSVKAAIGIVVVDKPIRERVKSFIEARFNADTFSFRFELFQEAELLVNVSKHVSVPKHVLLSSDEKSKLLERYKVKETQLPKILVTDVQARYLGACPGQVIRIIRPSPTAGQFVAVYRFVIPTTPLA